MVTLQQKSEEMPALSWSQISVTSTQKKHRTLHERPTNLLTNVSGIAQVGKILAVMGTSGVGKTTLTNVLSGRQGRALPITGEIYLNGCLTTSMQRITSGLIGYVEQHELFIDTMTLEEHLIFQAMLRMRNSLTDTQRYARVNTIVAQLNLNKCISTIIGQLSGGEKKRLALASVLLTEPHVILIDEPTSGLDTYLAKSVMSLIRSIAVEQNHAVIVVLHQPTNSMFDIIDTLCLLVQGGRQAFFGSKEEACRFFTTQCHLSATSLDGFIEQLAAPSSADNQYDIAQEVAANEYANSEEAQVLHMLIEDHVKSKEKNNMIPVDESSHTSFGRQLKWLLWRSLIDKKRNRMRTAKMAIRILVTTIVMGLTFYQLAPATNDNVHNSKVIAFFILLGLFDLNMSLVATGISSEQALVLREYKRRMYSLGAYYVSRIIVDIGYLILVCVLYISIILLFVDLRRSILVISVSTLCVIYACAVATFAATLSSKTRIVLLIINPLQQTFAVLSGIYINIRSIPLYFKWLQYLSYWFYGFNLLMILQWHHSDIRLPCEDKCFTRHVNITVQTNSTVCRRTGDESLTQLGIEYQDFGRDITIVVSLIITFHLLAFMTIVFKIRRAM